jgi:hypothetical protein
MNFVEVVRLAARGKKIRRKNWSREFYVYAGGSLRISDGRDYKPWIESILAEDWEVVE